MGDNTTHSTLSPSARHRWGVCPGSVREEARYPEPPSGPAALDGTRSHALLEHCINAGLIDPRTLVGTVFEYDHEGVKDSFPVEFDRAGRVNIAIEYIKSRIGYHPPIAEKRVFPDGLFGRADMHGTVDCQIPDKSIYEIIDYKDGMAPVSAKDNPQLEVYGLGVLAELPPENHPKVVRLTIIQPKLAMKGMPVVTSHDIKTADLLAKVPTIIAEAAATDDPNAPLVPGESQCKYCKAKGACSALAGKAMQEVNLMFAPVPSFPVTRNLTPDEAASMGLEWGAATEAPGTGLIDPSEFGVFEPVEVMDPAQQAAQKDPHTMSDEQLRQILEAEPLINQLLKGVKAEVERRLSAGQVVPGFKLVQGRGSRVWALAEDEIEKKLAGMGVPKTAIYKREMVSPAQAEKLVWDKKGEPQQLSKNQIERLNKEYVSTMAGKPTVAPESDPRPAINASAAALFGAVEPSEAEMKGIIVPAIYAAEAKAAGLPVPDFLAPPTPAAPEPTAIPAWLQVPDWLR